MSSPLREVLHALETAGAPISVFQLSSQLGVEPGALEGMIQFWIRKGRIRLSTEIACGTHGCSTCGVGESASHCPALLVVPRRYEVVPESY